MAVSEQDRQKAVEIETRAMDCCIDLPCRRLKVYIAEAIAQARAEGYWQGVEDAAKVVAHTGYGVLTRKQWREVADEIRALAETNGKE